MSCKVVNLRTPIQVRVTPPRRRKVDNPFCVTAALDSGRFHEVEYNVPAVLGNDGAIQNSTDMVVLAFTSMGSPAVSLACNRAVPRPAATGTI